MTALTKYDDARRALAEASRVDEVKDIRDKAKAMQEYAKQAKDSELIKMATEIKMRAERRAGEMLREMPKNKGTRGSIRGDIPVGGRAPRPPTDPAPKLSDLGISKDQASHWQRLAAMPEQQFEDSVIEVVERFQAKTEGRKKAKKKERAPTEKRAPVTHRARELVRPLVEANETVNAREIAKKHGMSHVIVETAVEAEIAALEARAEPAVNIEALASMTEKRKAELFRKQEKARLAAEFNKLVNEEVKRRMNEIFLPDLKEQIAKAENLYNRRRGIMDKPAFNKIRWPLNTDHLMFLEELIPADKFDNLVKRHKEGFQLFMSFEKRLLNEADSPTSWPDIPDDLAAWDRMRAQPGSAASEAHQRSATPMTEQSENMLKLMALVKEPESIGSRIDILKNAFSTIEETLELHIETQKVFLRIMKNAVASIERQIKERFDQENSAP